MWCSVVGEVRLLFACRGLGVARACAVLGFVDVSLLDAVMARELVAVRALVGGAGAGAES